MVFDGEGGLGQFLRQHNLPYLRQTQHAFIDARIRNLASKVPRVTHSAVKAYLQKRLHFVQPDVFYPIPATANAILVEDIFDPFLGVVPVQTVLQRHGDMMPFRVILPENIGCPSVNGPFSVNLAICIKILTMLAHEKDTMLGEKSVICYICLVVSRQILPLVEQHEGVVFADVKLLRAIHCDFAGESVHLQNIAINLVFTMKAGGILAARPLVGHHPILRLGEVKAHQRLRSHAEDGHS